MTDTNVASKQWYALITKPRQDKKLARYLELQNIEHYLPLIKIRRQWSDRLKLVDIPVLSPYLFIKSSSEGRNTVFESGSALAYVRKNGKPAVISESEIQLVQYLCKHGVEPEFVSEEIHRGDYVQIVAGPLKGIKGWIVEEHGRMRLGLKLEGIDCWARFSIEKKYIRKLNYN